MIADMFAKRRIFFARHLRFTSLLVWMSVWLALLGGSFYRQPTTVYAQESSTPEEIISPIETSTPAADGSIIHIVKPGEFIITIAEAYHIPLIDIFSLNNITDQTVIYPGQKLLIKRADRTPEPPPTETTIATTPPPATPTPTRRPTRTPRPTRTEQSGFEPSAAVDEVVATPLTVNGSNETITNSAEKPDAMLIMIGGLFAFGTVMILVGSLFRRRN